MFFRSVEVYLNLGISSMLELDQFWFDYISMR
jgi:hypothetical protein